jgi:hypothetical protein
MIFPIIRIYTTLSRIRVYRDNRGGSFESFITFIGAVMSLMRLRFFYPPPR